MRSPSIINALGVALMLVACGPQGDELAEPVPHEAAAPEGVADLECFDADYPIEPTFDRPEDALEHAVEAEGQKVSAPQDLDAYEQVERGEAAFDFEFRESDDVHHTWGIVRDEDGRWGMASLGGCVPVRP